MTRIFFYKLCKRFIYYVREMMNVYEQQTNFLFLHCMEDTHPVLNKIDVSSRILFFFYHRVNVDLVTQGFIIKNTNQHSVSLHQLNYVGQIFFYDQSQPFCRSNTRNKLCLPNIFLTQLTLLLSFCLSWLFKIVNFMSWVNDIK